MRSDNVYLTRMRNISQGYKINCSGDIVEDEGEISKVLFELSSNRRAALLMKVSQQSLKMQQLANSLEMTMTETFRHLQRLSESKLVEKKVDGSYILTPLGRLAIGFLSNFNFVLKNNEYFLTHDTISLPSEFVSRLGELSIGELSTDIMPTFNRITRIISEAQEYIWTMTDQTDTNQVKITAEKVAKGTKLKLIMQENLSEVAKPVPVGEQNVERKYLARLNACLLLNEKRQLITLRRVDGRMDYAGFFGTDATFHKWVRDFFYYYWNKALRWHPAI